MAGRGIDGKLAVAGAVDSDADWTVGSPAIGRAVARGAAALSLFGMAGAVGVAVDVLHIPGLFGHPVDARAGLRYLAWLCTVCGLTLVPQVHGSRALTGSTGARQPCTYSGQTFIPAS